MSFNVKPPGYGATDNSGASPQSQHYNAGKSSEVQKPKRSDGVVQEPTLADKAKAVASNLWSKLTSKNSE